MKPRNRDKCYYCDRAERCTKDHFFPKSKGGCLTVYACSRCQQYKSDLVPLDFLAFIKNNDALDDVYKNTLISSIESLIDEIEKNQIRYLRDNFIKKQKQSDPKPADGWLGWE